MVKAEERTVDLAFSSEEPVAQWYGIEILDHSNGSMRMDRANDGIALLFNHQRQMHIGIMENCRCDDDKKGRGTARFSRSAMAEEKWRDVQDGILKDVSVGYRVHMMKEMDPKEMTPDLMEMAAREKLPVYRITDWEPFECSMVPVAADPTVGVGRSAGFAPGPEVGTEQEKPPGVMPLTEERQPEAPKGASIISVPVKGERAMSIEVKEKSLEEITRDTEAQVSKAANDATDKERLRAKGIYEIWQKHNNFIPERARDKAIDERMPLADFQAYALNVLASKDLQPIHTPVSDLGMSRRDVERYSVSRAIMSQVPDYRGDASFELDCHKELVKRGIEPKNNGILLPYDIQRKLADPRGTKALEGQRDLSLASDAVGGYLKGTDHLGSEFIDVLRNSMVLRRAGARVLSGLRGNVAIPKRTVGVTMYWVAEGVAPTEGVNTFAQLALTPKNAAAYIDYTRNLLLQSNPSIDALVNGDLALSIATGIDLAGFHGTGTDQPQGIVGTSGVGSTTATAVDFGKMLDFQTDVAAANALASSCAYITTPAVAAILAAKSKWTNGVIGLWDGNILESSNVCGFRGFATNQITAGYCIFGDFSQVVIGEWGVLELLVNPFILSSIGVIRVTAFQSVDVGLRYPGAFSVSTSVTAA